MPRREQFFRSTDRIIAALGLSTGIVVIALATSQVLHAQPAETSPQLTYREHAAPILARYCGECHSADQRKAQLDLSTPDGILQGGESGASAVVAGNAEESPLLHMLRSGEMPPDDKPRPTAAELELLAQWITAGASGLEASASREDEARELGWHVLDVLEWKCAVCHGRQVHENDLDVRSVAHLLRGGKSGPVIVPGDPDASLLVKRIHADEMPPFKERYKFAVKPITADELQAIRQWVASGAIDPGPREVLGDEGDAVLPEEANWWAFQAPKKPKVPGVQQTNRVRTPVDAFVLQQLEAAGLTMSAEADRRTLIRRVFFDLTGLPPTAAQTEAFVADPDPLAYERLVDRLLQSPHYGERQAQRWLDAAGYAESEGLESADPVFPEMYRYRDYVVRSFNQDRPFDHFLTEQLAGDELVDWSQLTEMTPAAADCLVATGFLRTAMDSTREPAVNFYENRYQVLDDTVDIVSTSLLGLSMRCARCHSHKYDPLPQRDYYRFAAVFAGAYSPAEWLKPADRLRPLLAPAERQAIEQYNAPIQQQIDEQQKQLEELQKQFAKPLREKKLAELPEEVRVTVAQAFDTPEDMRTDEQKELLATYKEQVTVTAEELADASPDFRAQSEAIKKLIEQKKSELRAIPQAHALSDVAADPMPFYLLSRGEWNRRAAEVTPGVPAVLRNEQLAYRIDAAVPNRSSTGRRLALARWLTDPHHPLTARVFVNRTWRDFFGRGIVSTVDDFGRTGSQPSHPQLLDWLAREFIDRGWSVKQLHRLLVTSTVYRQASLQRPEAAAIDPENRLWWRMPLRRLDAEALRDSVLAACGELNHRMGGPSSEHETLADGQVVTPTASQHQRRSIYMLHRRLTPETMLETFDAPRMNPNCVERRHSTVVTQALFLLHSPVMERQSSQLAGRVRMSVGEDRERQVDQTYAMILGRMPSDDERQRALNLLTLSLETDPATGSAPQVDLLAELALVLFNSAEFLYVD